MMSVNNVVIPTTNEFVNVQGVKLNVSCKQCRSKWGVYLQADGSPPLGFDVCFKCQNIKIKKGECNKDYEQQQLNK